MYEFLWIIMAVGASVMWGLVYVLDKRVLSFLSVGELFFIYYSVSALVCLLVLPKNSLGTLWGKIKAPDHLPWVIVTILVSLGANYLIARSIQLSNATLAALIEISYPLFTILFSYLLLKTTTLNMHVAIGGTLIMAGVIWVSLFGH